jgi:predicted CXXCH cytochrome family protein
MNHEMITKKFQTASRQQINNGLYKKATFSKRRCIMKRMFIVLLAMVFMVGFGGIAMSADISGSKHDFSSAGAGQGASKNSTGEVCNTCHAPHNPSDASSGPLWDHSVTSATFTEYADPDSTMDATVTATIGAVSKLCLSCHDGSIAIDAFGGGSGTVSITGAANVGNDLSNDHPISFTYDTGLAGSDGELVTPTDSTQVVAGIPLFGGNLECATCHNAHDGAATYFLRVANAGSALCTTCHNK